MAVHYHITASRRRVVAHRPPGPGSEPVELLVFCPVLGQPGEMVRCVRVPALSIVLVSLSGCLPEKDETTRGDESDSSGTGETTAETGGGSDEGQTVDEGCEIPVGKPAPADVNDLCDVHGEYRGCHNEVIGDGTQFCDLGPNMKGWGDCLERYECIPGDILTCFSCESEFGLWTFDCELHDGVPWSGMDCTTPLVLRFDAAPVEFAASTEQFWMSAADGCGSTDWPTAATPWLGIDLDRSGSIEGGHELFGSGTAIGATFASDGFAALALLDSDGDRSITPRDARWGELLLWADHDQDRRSGPWELEALASRGVTAIDLGFSRSSSRCDARGNCEVERASVALEDRELAEVIDVRLACQ